MTPHTLHFQLTERCNLACPGCYLPARTGPGKSAAEIEARVFAPLAAAGVKFTTLTGGEPLVHAQCAEICAASARHFQETQLVCNGTLLAPDAFFRLAAAGVTSFKVSVDGMDAATHDRARGKEGTFELVLGNLRAILSDPRRADCPAQIGTITVVSPENVGRLAELARLLLDLGLDSVLFQPFHPFGLVFGRCGGGFGPLPGASPEGAARPAADPAFMEALAAQTEALLALKKAEPARIDNSLEMLAALPAFHTRPGGPAQVCGANRFVFVNSAFEARGCLFCEPLGSLADLSPAGLYASAPWKAFQNFRRSCRLCLMGCQFIGKAQRLMELGFDCIKREDPGKARVLFEASLARADSPQARHGLGKALADLEDLNAALPLLRRAREESPRCLSLALDLAQALCLAKGGAGETAEALGLLRQVAPWAAGSAQHLWLLGQRLALAGDLPAAEEALSRALALQPSAVLARADLADVFLRTDRPAEAVALLHAAGELPECSRVFHVLGLALLRLGREAEAEDALRRAVAVKGRPFIRADLGDLVRRRGRAAEAAGILAESVALFPDHAHSRHMLGLCLQDLKDHARAAVELLESVRLDPDKPFARYDLGVSLMALSRDAEAFVHLSRAVELDSGFPWSRFNLGMVLQRLGRPEEALPHLEAAVALDPGFPWFSWRLANLLARLGRSGPALAAYDRAIGLKKDFARFHLDRAFLLSALGRAAEAAESRVRALALDPGLADVPCSVPLPPTFQE